MFIAFLIIFLLSICYLTYFYDEHAECETERQALIASIEKLRTKPVVLLPKITILKIHQKSVAT